jgi:hypothetical protein
LECEIHAHHTETAHIEQEIDRYKIDILWLSEVRWPMNMWESNVVLQQGGWVTSGRSWNDVVTQGQNVLVEWKPIDKRLMYATFSQQL